MVTSAIEKINKIKDKGRVALYTFTDIASVKKIASKYSALKEDILAKYEAYGELQIGVITYEGFSPEAERYVFSELGLPTQLMIIGDGIRTVNDIDYLDIRRLGRLCKYLHRNDVLWVYFFSEDASLPTGLIEVKGKNVHISDVGLEDILEKVVSPGKLTLSVVVS